MPTSNGRFAQSHSMLRAAASPSVNIQTAVRTLRCPGERTAHVSVAGSNTAAGACLMSLPLAVRLVYEAEHEASPGLRFPQLQEGNAPSRYAASSAPGSCTEQPSGCTPSQQQERQGQQSCCLRVFRCAVGSITTSPAFFVLAMDDRQKPYADRLGSSGRPPRGGRRASARDTRLVSSPERARAHQSPRAVRNSPDV
jgi:hypothetical protein